MIRTGKELAAACEAAAKNYKSLYVLGCFGAPMTEANKARWKAEQSYNRRSDRAAKIDAVRADTFGFDCVGLIKALLWGWNGDYNHRYGGTSYGSNGVPDIDEGAMIRACSGVTTDFSRIEVGEVVWLDGHIGVYIGNGLAVEATPKWKDGVQVTAVLNIGSKAGYDGRKWTKHGKLPYITYDGKADTKPKGDYTMEMRMLRKGDKGEDVRALQILLMGRGIKLPKYGADADFGAETDTAVRKYQKAKGLEVDGIVGTATMRSLMGV